MYIEFRVIGGRDLACDFHCECPDEKWAGSEIAHLMKRRIYLYGYNDVNFFKNVNAEPREFACKCGRVYTQQWFVNGSVEIKEKVPAQTVSP